MTRAVCLDCSEMRMKEEPDLIELRVSIQNSALLCPTSFWLCSLFCYYYKTEYIGFGHFTEEAFQFNGLSS